MLISASLSGKEKAGQQGFAEAMGDPEWLRDPPFPHPFTNLLLLSLTMEQ